MNEYESYLWGLFKTRDYILGKEINELIEKKFKVKYPRTILLRAVANKVISSSAPVTFGNGQFAYYSFGSSLNKNLILKIAKKYRPPLYRLITMMELNDGIISRHEFLKFASVPFDNSKAKSDSIEKLAEDLKNLNLAVKITDNDNVYFVNPTSLQNHSDLILKHNTRMTNDVIFIYDIMKSLQGYNIISNSSFLYRNKNTLTNGIIHNNYVWDAIAYTKTTGINPGRASEADTPDKQTLVVLDIVISRPYTDDDLQGFYSRIQSMLHAVITGERKVLPVIIFATIESELILNRIHKLGFLTFNIGSIFSARIYDVIKNISSISENESDSLNSIENVLLIIRNAGQEDNLAALKGHLFEFLMFRPLQLLYSDAIIEHGKTLSTNDELTKEKTEGYEYDYIITSTRLQQIIVVELKGYASSKFVGLGEDKDSKGSLRYFFVKTFPFAERQLKQGHSNYQFKAMFITSSNFMEDGIKFLEQINAGSLKPDDVDCWYDGKKLIALLKKQKLTKIQSILKQYYFTEDNSTQKIKQLKASQRNVESVTPLKDNNDEKELPF